MLSLHRQSDISSLNLLQFVRIISLTGIYKISLHMFPLARLRYEGLHADKY